MYLLAFSQWKEREILTRVLPTDVLLLHGLIWTNALFVL
jgi:hypothetical protein